MKILMISHEYPPVGGGGANACMFLSKEFLGKGNEVSLVTVKYGDQPAFEETKEGLKIYRVKAKRKHKEHCSFPEMASFVMKAIPMASKLAKSEKYDKCMIYFGIPSGPVGLYLKWKYKLPYIIRFGGGDIPGFQERFKVVYKLIGPFVKYIWSKADALVANSEGLKQFALNFCNKYPVKVVPNGVDTKTYMPLEKFESVAKAPVIQLLFVSRLIERKGLQFLIPKLREIETETGRKIHFTIVGDGPYRETLELMAKEAGASELISFEGQKDKSELLDYYHKGHIFVFPSKREGMPNAVLEAMACGLAVVMTPCEGASELIRGNGIVTEKTEDMDFYKSVVSLINDSRVDDMRRESAKRAESVFSWNSVAQAYLEIME